MSLEETFKRRVRAFVAKHKMAESTFGREAADDSKFYCTLMGNRSPTLRKADNVLEWMKQYKPPGK